MEPDTKKSVSRNPDHHPDVADATFAAISHRDDMKKRSEWWRIVQQRRQEVIDGTRPWPEDLPKPKPFYKRPILWLAALIIHPRRTETDPK